MRFLVTLRNDISYQIKYGFYLLYAFISLLYILILALCPLDYKNMIASIIIFSDPAMLGMFFIGGLWMLEKGEGIHRFWIVSPLKSIEYIGSKGISLGIISTFSTLLVSLADLRASENFITLLFGVLLGSMTFTIIGMLFASYARSINQYIVYITLPSIFFAIPPILTALGITHPLLDIMPGTALWHIISYSMSLTNSLNPLVYIILLLWLIIVFLLGMIRIPVALGVEEGEQI